MAFVGTLIAAAQREIFMCTVRYFYRPAWQVLVLLPKSDFYFLGGRSPKKCKLCYQLVSRLVAFSLVRYDFILLRSFVPRGPIENLSQYRSQKQFQYWSNNILIR